MKKLFKIGAPVSLAKHLWRFRAKLLSEKKNWFREEEPMGGATAHLRRGPGNLTLGVLLVFVFPIADVIFLDSAVLGDVGCDCLKLGH